MVEQSTTDQIRVLLNVSDRLGATYARRYQRALDVVLALVEPYAQPLTPPYSHDRGGSDYGRGFADGLHAKAHQVLAEMVRVLVADDKLEAIGG